MFTQVESFDPLHRPLMIPSEIVMAKIKSVASLVFALGDGEGARTHFQMNSHRPIIHPGGTPGGRPCASCSTRVLANEIGYYPKNLSVGLGFYLCIGC